MVAVKEWPSRAIGHVSSVLSRRLAATSVVSASRGGIEPVTVIAVVGHLNALDLCVRRQPLAAHDRDALVRDARTHPVQAA